MNFVVITQGVLNYEIRLLRRVAGKVNANRFYCCFLDPPALIQLLIYKKTLNITSK